MKNKGFTLIELLAVIVILAIIALIAVPIILGIINNVREESNKRSIELYASAVKNGIALSQLSTGKAVKPGSYTSNTLPFEVKYDGDVNCTAIEIYEDGTIFVENCTVNQETVEYAYGKSKGTDKPCTLEDLDGNGVASLSDVVTCGTESFYVMANENNEITMLSMYNLDVGNIYDYSTGVLEAIENPTNKQSQQAKGCIYGDSTCYGTVAFSATVYWGTSTTRPEYVYNKNSNLYSYVSEYERILKEELNVKSAKATLIRNQQLADLGCDYLKELGDGYGELENPTPEWVYSTSYWTGSAVFEHYLLCMESGFNYMDPEYDDRVGVRPVVTISTSEF